MQNQPNPADQPCSSSPGQQQQEQQQQQQQQQQHLLGVPANQQCWKSTPDAESVNCHHPPRLSLSAILPLSAAGSRNNHEASSKKSGSRGRPHCRHASEDSGDRTMLPVCAGRRGRSAAAAASAPASPEPSLARRFLSNPHVRRSLAIDAASLLVFVPLSIGSSVALLRLFVQRMGPEQLEWHHYMLVAALASLLLVPVGRLIYSACRYRRRFVRMRAAQPDYQLRHPPKECSSDYTAKSRRIEAEGAARAQDYHQFAFLVAKQQNIDLTRRGGDYSGLSVGRYGLPPPPPPPPAAAPAGDRSRAAANLSGLSCHRPDISMAAYNC